MPYFIYRISAKRKLSQVDEFEHYRDARTEARKARADQSDDDAEEIKIIFANDTAEAEALLRVKKEKILREDD